MIHETSDSNTTPAASQTLPDGIIRACVIAGSLNERGLLGLNAIADNAVGVERFE